MPIPMKIHDNTSEVKVKTSCNIDKKYLESLINAETKERILADETLQREIEEIIAGGASSLNIIEYEDGSIIIELLNSKGEILSSQSITKTEKIIKSASLDWINSKIIFTCLDNSTFECSLSSIKEAINNEITRATQAEQALDTKIDNVNNSKVTKTSESSKVYGTDENGNQTTYDKDSFGQVDDVKVNNESVVTNKIANIDLTSYEEKVNKTTSLTDQSTNTQYPSAKCVYDELQSIYSLIASGSLTQIAWSQLSPYRLVVFSGYKSGIGTPNKTSFILDTTSLAAGEKAIFTLSALEGSSNWSYRVVVERNALDGNCYWWSDLDYSGNTVWTASNIFGIK